ncbi:MAG: hypothetical protein KIS78_35370 [Labilithrix sp.]|nr:hypothetical protein [Labilithrix sp.]MCW5837728.1 hypothetical protein [Labilithrix sp.]
MRPRRLSSIPAPESAPASRARLHQLSSEIVEIQRAFPSRPPEEDDEVGVPSTMPSGGWSRMAGVLVEIAVHHVVVRDLEAARRTANDALVLLDMMVEEPVQQAELSLSLGEVLLEVHESHRARERFEAAVAVFDQRRDRGAAARARVGLARAMASLGDPVARAVLEDAGTAFEDLGDDEAVRAIDVELREVTASFDESPSSFQAVSHVRPRR